MDLFVLISTPRGSLKQVGPIYGLVHSYSCFVISEAPVNLV